MLCKVETEQLKSILREAIVKKETPGANLLVFKDGKEILYHNDGFADLEDRRPVARNTIFRLYSMSKPITAAAVMILLERGRIDLYEPVSRFLPGFGNQMAVQGDRLVPVERAVNLKDLLSMTSGLVYDGADRAGQETLALFREIDRRLTGDRPLTTLEAMNKLGGCPLAFQPGSRWQYGTSADVLGAVVEVASGVSFGEFLEKEIFRPLNMVDTAFHVPLEKRARLAKAYEYDASGELVPYMGSHLGIINNMDRIPSFESGGAGLASTIDDYARFSRMLINGGVLDGVRLLRQKTVQYLTSCTLNREQQKSMWPELSGYSYGNLMRVMSDCSKAGILASPGEYGWDGWLGGYFCNCPQEKLTFLFMMQRTNTGTIPLTRKLRNIILDTQYS